MAVKESKYYTKSNQAAHGAESNDRQANNPDHKNESRDVPQLNANVGTPVLTHVNMIVTKYRNRFWVENLQLS